MPIEHERWAPLEGNFYALRKWSDDDWRVARERIEAQNAKDRAAR